MEGLGGGNCLQTSRPPERAQPSSRVLRKPVVLARSAAGDPADKRLPVSLIPAPGSMEHGGDGLCLLKDELKQERAPKTPLTMSLGAS